MLNSPQSAEYIPAIKERYSDSYFVTRVGNDPKRQAQFFLDAAFIRKYCLGGTLCDVGCSTGEFVRYLNWNGKAYGMEINDSAKALASDTISFDKNIFTETEFFDLIIFRGTIQHVDEPFRMMKASFKALKPGGYIIFLATPNTNSLLYKLKGTLGFLSPPFNFYIPGDRELSNALTNYGFKVLNIEYPYLQTPYANPVSDHWNFIKNIFSRKFYPHAFWKNSMNLAAQKP